MISFARYFKPGVVVRVAGQEARDVPLADQATPQGPRITFMVSRTMTRFADTCSVSIYNLAPERREAMSQLFHEYGTTPIEIDAGYDGKLSKLFVGDVRKMRASERYDLDYATYIEADDQGDALADVTVNIKSGLMSPDLMVDAALKVIALGGAVPGSGVRGVVIRRHSSVDEAIAALGPNPHSPLLVSIGKASDLLTEAARICECRWFIRSGTLYFARGGRAIDNARAISLPRDLWLSEPSDDGSNLSVIRVMFDPNIEPGKQVAVIGRTSANSREYYRVESCVHSGDTETSAPWSTDISGRRISAGPA